MAEKEIPTGEMNHPKLPEAMTLMEHYKDEVAGLCKIFGELAVAGDRWAFSFMTFTIQDIIKQSLDKLNEVAPPDEPAPNLSEFSCFKKW